MTLPRQVLPGQTYLFTRRCVERRFLLRPDPEVTQALLYCLALAAERHGVEVSAVCALANHVHLVLHDPRGVRPRFAQQFLANAARALNVHRRRGESLWAPGSYSAVRCTDDREAVLARLVYTLTNVVEAGLVARPEDWPGICTLPEDVGLRELEVARPRFFFRPAAAGEERVEAGEETARDRARRRAPSREPLPETVRLRITKPREFADMPDEEFRRLLRARVDARIAEIHARRAAQGRVTFLGAAAVLRQDPNGAPAGGTFPTGALNPRLSWSDRWRCVERKLELIAFWRAHAEARDRFRAGERDVVFPPGTWHAVHVYGARARPPDRSAA
jgi:REP element-mobilizing transposase RayT